MRRDIYQSVTNTIVTQLEQGVRPWFKPWSSEHAAGRITRPLRHNGVPYKGINVLSLWAEAETKGYAAPIWMTFKQAEEHGAFVRKGEKGSLVVFADKITREEKNEQTGEDASREIHFLKGYTVFNVQQIEGLPERFHAMKSLRADPIHRIAHAENYFGKTGADIRYGGTRAYYSQSSDHVQMPHFEAFKDAESFYATLAHELTHWTKHKSRLDREFGRKRFGDEGYAMEELVAELGAAFLSADLDLTPAPREEHAAYIASWLKVLKQDTRAIFAAAAFAQKAADYIAERGISTNQLAA